MSSSRSVGGRRKSVARRSAKEAGYRSGFEQRVASALARDGIAFDYEPKDAKIEYSRPPSTYLPDFVLENGVIVEAKGRFTSADRAKHLLIKKQRPELDIRFVFQEDRFLTKRSSTRYSEWCERHGFPYAVGSAPASWADEISEP